MPDLVAPEFIALQQALVGRYSLERELGRGGMGIVFLARDVALDRPVAIKLLPPALAQRADLKERFLREAQTAAKLSQPNIVPIHAVERAGDLVYFVMAYVDGVTLGERLRTQGPLTPHEAVRVLREVAWALGYAHGRDVVHRDVKPDNIMLERGTGRAVVMDFGIAAVGADAAGIEAFGTAPYMSPEQINGEPVDGRSDLYALGAVMFLALTGRLPFEAEDAAGMLAMHVARPAPPVASVTPGIPRLLAAAVDRCLQKDPAARHANGEALADAVAQAVEPRRELPVPVRLWLTKGQESRMGYVLWYGGMGVPFGFGLGQVASIWLGPTLGFILGINGYVWTPIVIHTLNRLWRLRRLLGAGYAVEDAKLAVRELAERRREEVTYEYGHEPPLWAKAVRKLMIASGATFIGTVLLVFVTGNVGTATLTTSLVAASTWLVTSILQTAKPGRRLTSDLGAELRRKFWDSRFAKWFEKIARFGLKSRATPAELTYRPTELAIGLAADALFDALPKEQRRELKELPGLVERLQRDAQVMRQTLDGLNNAIAGLGEEAPAARSHALAAPGAADTAAVVADARARLRHDLVQQRDQAAARLGAAVAALESIRLNLLRLKAGTGTVSELTADLGAAREAQSELEIAVAARSEVETLLDGARALTGEFKRSGEQPLAGAAHA